MSEQWTTCLQQRMEALYRYTHAMEHGDVEAMSSVLAEAEQDRVLERMILETNEGYQIEDRTVAHADDIETVQHMLHALMPEPPTTPLTTHHNPSIHPLQSLKKPAISINAYKKDHRSSAQLQSQKSSRLSQLLTFRYSWLVAALAVLLVMVSLPATNVLADRFLSLFRVQQFQPVSIDSEQSAETLFTTLQAMGDLQFQRHASGNNRQNLTQAQAERIIGYHILLPDHLPAGVSNNQSITISGGEQVIYTFSASKATTYLAKNGQSSVAIPAGLDGASYTITVAPSVHVNYSACPANKGSCQQKGKTFFINEVAGPSVQSNGNASITQLRDFLLSLPKLSPSARDLLKHLDERTGTIPVPIPPQASAEQVIVHGTSGLLLKSNSMSAVIWETQGIVYITALGTGDRTQMLDAVNSLV